MLGRRGWGGGESGSGRGGVGGCVVCAADTIEGQGRKKRGRKGRVPDGNAGGRLSRPSLDPSKMYIPESPCYFESFESRTDFTGKL